MKRCILRWFHPVIILLAMPALMVSSPLVPAAEPRDRELQRHRLIGEAHYENGDYEAAAAEFRRCCELAPESAADRYNAALVQARARNHPEALKLLDQVRQLDPDLLNVPYLRGIIYKRESRFEDAVACLLRVAQADAQCWGTRYNLGVCYKSLKRNDQAIRAFEEATRIDPAHPSAFYQLITLARRAGDMDAAKQYTERFEVLNARMDDSEKTPEALERSQYTRIIRLPRATSATGAAAAEIRFTECTQESGLANLALPPPPAWTPRLVRRADYRAEEVRRRYVPATGGGVALADYDSDGDLDIYLVRCAAESERSANVLLANQGDGRFVDVTADTGVGDRGLGTGAVFGDFDNDGDQDLYVVNCGPNVMYRNRGDLTFEDISVAAHADEPQFARQAALVDYDHDNDLDLLIVNDVELSDPPSDAEFRVPDDCYGQVNSLLRNNGNGTFVDQTDEAGLLVDCSQSRCLVYADFDGDFDTDLFIGNAGAPSMFFANSRLGKFKPAEAFSPSIDGDVQAADAGDFDRDGDEDLVVAVGGQLRRYTNGGHGDFRGSAIALPEALRSDGLARIKTFDYNNDGWLDLLLIGAGHGTLSLLAGGDDDFRDVTDQVGLGGSWGWIADTAAGDVDGDGDIDVLLHTRDRGPRLLRNDSQQPTHWLTVRLEGQKVNRNGYGATVEIAAAGHYQRQTARGGWLNFGLGDLDRVDVVRVTWPNGVAQNAIRPRANEVLTIKEEVRVSASCAMLWAFNGNEFEFVNEILGVGALGVPIRPGEYHAPDCTELTKIEARQLVARNGRYELRLTEELREITYADRFALRVVDHPPGLEIIPNEMFTAPPFPADKFYAVKEPRFPRTAIDERGRDVLARVKKRDGRWPSFPLAEYQGLAQPHSLTLDFGDLPQAETVTLYLDGWIHWPESSTVIAIAQDPRHEIQPLSLQVLDQQGKWQTVIDSLGLPTSKGAVVPVDLSDRFLSGDRRVRLTTNLCVYFDRIFVAAGNDADQIHVRELPVQRGELRYRGFSRMTRDRFGFERFDYADVSPTGPWSPPLGRFTRYGDVTPLLSQADDMFAIFGPGDELAIQFDTQSLPELPSGWVRDFVFLAEGWVKDGDLNTACSDHVMPLPFHGMSAYPYPADEHHPRSETIRRYHRKYNTRPSSPTVGDLR